MRKCRNCKNRAFYGWCGIEYCIGYEMTDNEKQEVQEAENCCNYEEGTPNCLLEECERRNYCKSATAGDYSPSCPWNAEGMSIRDFI